MNRYNLAHVTNFAYDGPVSESYNELRLRPRHDETSELPLFSGDDESCREGDRRIGIIYGNWVHQFSIFCRSIGRCGWSRKPWCWCIRSARSTSPL